mgnify:CR=1 FL=1
MIVFGMTGFAFHSSRPASPFTASSFTFGGIRAAFDRSALTSLQFLGGSKKDDL